MASALIHTQNALQAQSRTALASLQRLSRPALGCQEVVWYKHRTLQFASLYPLTVSPRSSKDRPIKGRAGKLGIPGQMCPSEREKGDASAEQSLSCASMQLFGEDFGGGILCLLSVSVLVCRHESHTWSLERTESLTSDSQSGIMLSSVGTSKCNSPACVEARARRGAAFCIEDSRRPMTQYRDSVDSLRDSPHSERSDPTAWCHCSAAEASSVFCAGHRCLPPLSPRATVPWQHWRNSHSSPTRGSCCPRRPLW